MNRKPTSSIYFHNALKSLVSKYLNNVFITPYFVRNSMIFKTITNSVDKNKKALTLFNKESLSPTSFTILPIKSQRMKTS